MPSEKEESTGSLVVETAKNGNNLHNKLKQYFQQNKVIMIIKTLTINTTIIIPIIMTFHYILRV